MPRSIAALVLAIALGSPAACMAADPPSRAAAGAAANGCLPDGDGYLRARVRGALDLDLDWRNDEMECTGGVRPDGSGVRVSIAGPLRSDGRRLRFVFGIVGAAEGAAARQRPTNLTVIFEGERRLFATQGDDKCTVDSLTQARTGPLGGPQRSWRVEAHGFCTGPAATLAGDTRLLVTRFDFAGRIDLQEDALP
ncbi:MAG: hypothetical protein AB7G51_08080 [Steroidobacteraceae bacterium]